MIPTPWSTCRWAQADDRQRAGVDLERVPLGDFTHLPADGCHEHRWSSALRSDRSHLTSRSALFSPERMPCCSVREHDSRSNGFLSRRSLALARRAQPGPPVLYERVLSVALTACAGRGRPPPVCCPCLCQSDALLQGWCRRQTWRCAALRSDRFARGEHGGRSPSPGRSVAWRLLVRQVVGTA